MITEALSACIVSLEGRPFPVVRISKAPLGPASVSAILLRGIAKTIVPLEAAALVAIAVSLAIVEGAASI